MTEKLDAQAAGQEALQWVIFKLGPEEYGVVATQIQEISMYSVITHVPSMPKFVKGVVNLRGRIVPILDLKERFEIVGGEGLASARRIVVALFGDQLIGLIVDAILGVVRIPPEAIEPVPPTLPKMDAEYLLGVGKLSERLIVLLNLDRMLDDMEKRMLKDSRVGDKAAK